LLFSPLIRIYALPPRFLSNFSFAATPRSYIQTYICSPPAPRSLLPAPFISQMPTRTFILMSLQSMNLLKHYCKHPRLCVYDLMWHSAIR
jgi:hypothetical protein